MDNPRRAFILSDMNTDTDIAVIGGGLNGPLLALAMASQGHRVTVIDATAQSVRKNAAFDGRSYAVALTSQRLLAGLGLWRQLADNAQAMLEIKVTDGRAGEGPSPFFMHFDHAEIEEGPMGYMVQDRHLRRALIDAMDASDHITQLSGHAVTGQRAHAAGITLTLDNGKLLTAQLAVGADGRASGTAQRAGIKRIAWSYDQTALVCAIEHDLPHHGIAHQFFMPQGPLAILPLPGNVSSIVWSETDANARAFNALPDADYIDMLRPRFGDFLGDIRLTGKRWTYPLGLSLTTEMVADRVALIGDAAHGVHPIAGQGLNAGMRDIAALAEVLTDATRRGEDIGSVATLTRYQEWRRFDNTALAMATDAFNRLFSNDNPILRIGRDIGMGVIGALPGLRRGAIREAAGLTGELPRLMQGKPL
ncbi:2-octaprenyl-6-methoxyphenol hydroxylase [Pseudosulfitobacter pseudonitzschiae]|uniref:2-octaprenyl-6-methoxyphenyl hydroxylase n=2 Tax=Pseudosulfitobacter pseudonitzschiae TaxID=1402135 RepID=A0A073JHV6_9RHOB|nr:2-octaprenyl-6-methoxyphenyl hydroxylase [Pseudosulfitobacter pseudonitzschiae]QKS10295.1 UbiH/UbiF/VisC/COQ6 family ubiquinone biosynthesis hydroxylase [Pseudosulfitobacter pseudonitzschiae]SHF56383.1 2-octaprenyl-6-methoxyphenol hydroxylase [Pseudosulfitobacter pseudonitzschiae]